MVLQYESEELMSLIANLKDYIVQEKCEIDRLQTKLASVGIIVNARYLYLYLAFIFQYSAEYLKKYFKMYSIQLNILIYLLD